MTLIEECELILRAIERREITLTVINPEIFEAGNGDVEYLASNGWKIVVFDDSYAWDYIDSFVSPDGRTLAYEEMVDDTRDLGNYEPSDDALKSIWHWKGNK